MIDIYLNIYDIHNSNYILESFGIGAYHSAIKINNIEISFSKKKGIYYLKLENAPKVKESIFISSIDMNENELYEYIYKCNYKYNSNTYNYLENNCNNFTNEILEILFKKKIPNHVNRLACIFRNISCILPHNLINNSQENTIPEMDEIPLIDLIQNGPLFF